MYEGKEVPEEVPDTIRLVKALELLIELMPTCAADENGKVVVVVQRVLVQLRESGVNSTPGLKAALTCLNYQPWQERGLTVLRMLGLRWLRRIW